eukprot:gene11380-12079_t
MALQVLMLLSTHAPPISHDDFLTAQEPKVMNSIFDFAGATQVLVLECLEVSLGPRAVLCNTSSLSAKASRSVPGTSEQTGDHDTSSHSSTSTHAPPSAHDDYLTTQGDSTARISAYSAGASSFKSSKGNASFRAASKGNPIVRAPSRGNASFRAKSGGGSASFRATRNMGSARRSKNAAAITAKDAEKKAVFEGAQSDEERVTAHNRFADITATDAEKKAVFVGAQSDEERVTVHNRFADIAAADVEKKPVIVVAQSDEERVTAHNRRLHSQGQLVLSKVGATEVSLDSPQWKSALRKVNTWRRDCNNNIHSYTNAHCSLLIAHNRMLHSQGQLMPSESGLPGTFFRRLHSQSQLGLSEGGATEVSLDSLEEHIEEDTSRLKRASSNRRSKRPVPFGETPAKAAVRTSLLKPDKVTARNIVLHHHLAAMEREQDSKVGTYFSTTKGGWVMMLDEVTARNIVLHHHLAAMEREKDSKVGTYFSTAKGGWGAGLQCWRRNLGHNAGGGNCFLELWKGEPRQAVSRDQKGSQSSGLKGGSLWPSHTGNCLLEGPDKTGAQSSGVAEPVRWQPVANAFR